MRVLILFIFLSTFFASDSNASNSHSFGNQKNYIAYLSSRVFSWMYSNQYHETLRLDFALVYRFLQAKFAAPAMPIMLEKRKFAIMGKYSNVKDGPFVHLFSEIEVLPLMGEDRIPQFDRITHLSLWCDRLNMPEEFIEQIAAQGSRGGYFVTHMYLAILLLKEKNCNYFRKHFFRFGEMEKKFASDLTQIIQQNGFGDLQVEAAAFLYLGNAGHEQTTHYVEAVLKEVDEIYSNPYVSLISAHTTFFLYWTLLEYLRPDAPKLPFSRRYLLN